MVFSDLPPHAEAQRHHVVFLAVCGEAALDVVEQGRLQIGALQREGVTDIKRKSRRGVWPATAILAIVISG